MFYTFGLKIYSMIRFLGPFTNPSKALGVEASRTILHIHCFGFEILFGKTRAFKALRIPFRFEGRLRNVLLYDFFYLSQIMNESGQMKPIVVWIVDSYTFCCLKCVHNIRYVDVGIAFVDQIVQLLQGFYYAGFEFVELQPSFALFANEIYAHIRMHFGVSFADTLFQWIVFVDGVVTVVADWFWSEFSFRPQKFGRIDVSDASLDAFLQNEKANFSGKKNAHLRSRDTLIYFGTVQN